MLKIFETGILNINSKPAQIMYILRVHTVQNKYSNHNCNNKYQIYIMDKTCFTLQNTIFAILYHM